MNLDDFDAPNTGNSWITDERGKVIEYLNRQGVNHGGVPDEPAWFVAPFLAIWPVLSVNAPRTVAWWAVSGDVPTDCISSDGVPDAREAMSEFSKRWLELSEYMLKGRPHPEIRIGTPDQWPELGDLLFRRANLLAEFTADEDNWKWQQ